MRGFTVVGLAALAAAACGYAPAGERGTWTPETAWRLEVVWTAGGADAEGDAAFGDVRGLAVDGADRAWVLDYQAQHLVVLDADGGVLRTVGRRGGGPGEFQGLYGVTVTADQAVWTPDHRNARFTVFDTAGAVVHTYPRPVGCRSYVWPGGATSDGTIRDVVCGRVDGRFVRYVARFDVPGNAYVDSLAVPPPPVDPPFYRFSFGNSETLMAVPFAPDQRWTMGPDGLVWLGWTGTYDLVKLNAAGDTVVRIVHAQEPVPVSDAERAEQETALRDAARGQDVDLGLIPRAYPLFERMIPDRDGYLWVMRRAPGPVWVLDVFDPQGIFLGSVGVPSGLELDPFLPVVIRGGAMWTVTRDSLDAPVVTRFRIRGR